MEIEVKIRLKKPTKLRSSLKSAGATFEGRVLEKNWLYDYSDRILVRTDKVLRVREDRRGYVTFKGKGPRQESEYKEREELEIEFPDASSARALLKSVGFLKWLYYEKIRETWLLEDCEIVLDELPGLGIFVEIEASSKEKIDKVVKKLKLPRKYISTTYVEMLQEHAASADTHTQEFKFPTHYASILEAD